MKTKKMQEDGQEEKKEGNKGNHIHEENSQNTPRQGEELPRNAGSRRITFGRCPFPLSILITMLIHRNMEKTQPRNHRKNDRMTQKLFSKRNLRRITGDSGDGVGFR